MNSEIVELEPLEISEVERKEELERTIERNLRSFYEVGSALLEIRDSRLYKNTHATFEDYCRDRWDFVASRARQLIASATVTENIVGVTIVTPTNEAQTRPLTKLETPELQQKAWQRAVETAPEGKITARHVSTVVRDIVGEEVKERKTKGSKKQEGEVISEEFLEAWRTMCGAIENAKHGGWKETRKEDALKRVDNLRAIIMIGGGKGDV